MTPEKQIDVEEMLAVMGHVVDQSQYLGHDTHATWPLRAILASLRELVALRVVEKAAGDLITRMSTYDNPWLPGEYDTLKDALAAVPRKEGA